MQDSDSGGHGSEDMRASDFYRVQLPKARFFKKMCKLFREEITHVEALSYVMPGEVLKDTPITPSDRKSSTTRCRAFCYSIRLYTLIQDGNWEAVSKIIENYNIPVTIGSIKSMFEKANDEARKMDELQSVKFAVEEF